MKLDADEEGIDGVLHVLDFGQGVERHLLSFLSRRQDVNIPKATPTRLPVFLGMKMQMGTPGAMNPKTRTDARS